MRQTFAFDASSGFGLGLKVSGDDLSDRDFGQPRRRKACAVRRRLDADVGRLYPRLGLDELFKGAVDDVEDCAVATEVGGQPALDAVLRHDDFFDDFQIGLDIGAAKSIDRLFWIADDEQFAGL